jgi:hypothetical protein
VTQKGSLVVGPCEEGNETSRPIYCAEFLTIWASVSFSVAWRQVSSQSKLALFSLSVLFGTIVASSYYSLCPETKKLQRTDSQPYSDGRSEGKKKGNVKENGIYGINYGRNVTRIFWRRALPGANVSMDRVTTWIYQAARNLFPVVTMLLSFMFLMMSTTKIIEISLFGHVWSKVHLNSKTICEFSICFCTKYLLTWKYNEETHQRMRTWRPHDLYIETLTISKGKGEGTGKVFLVLN